MKLKEEAKVIANLEVCTGMHKLLLKAPEIAAIARPMQFVMIKAADGPDPLLRRPIAVAGLDTSEGTLELLVASVGRGTRILNSLSEGASVDVLGPLGNPLPAKVLEYRNLAMVAGGTGIAPLSFLAAHLRTAGTSGVLYYGARSASFLVPTESFLEAGVRVAVSTDDGSAGMAGTVLDLLDKHLRLGLLPKENLAILGCGPRGMLVGLKKFCDSAKIPLYVSLEERMACGTGLCRGCAVPRTSGGYAHVCVDGPVFDAREIML